MFVRFVGEISRDRAQAVPHELTEAGDVTPVIGKTYPLRQAPDAMRDLQAGHARGKLVITVTDAG